MKQRKTTVVLTIILLLLVIFSAGSLIFSENIRKENYNLFARPSTNIFTAFYSIVISIIKDECFQKPNGSLCGPDLNGRCYNGLCRRNATLICDKECQSYEINSSGNIYCKNRTNGLGCGPLNQSNYYMGACYNGACKTNSTLICEKDCQKYEVDSSGNLYCQNRVDGLTCGSYSNGHYLGVCKSGVCQGGVANPAQ